MIGSDYTTGDGLSLGVSLVLLEFPDSDWIKADFIAALETMTIEENWRKVGNIEPEHATRIFSLILQTIIFNYEPPDMTPIGTMAMWGSNTPPANWLLCEGQLLNEVDYPDLFAAIGTEWGTGGTGTFNLPDFSGRSPMHPGGSVGLGLASQGGEAMVTLSTAQMPAHTHPPLSPHVQFIGLRNAGGTLQPGAGTAYGIMANTGSTGGGGAHNNLHPVVGVNFIIKAL